MMMRKLYGSFIWCRFRIFLTIENIYENIIIQYIWWYICTIYTMRSATHTYRYRFILYTSIWRITCVVVLNKCIYIYLLYTNIIHRISMHAVTRQMNVCGERYVYSFSFHPHILHHTYRTISSIYDESVYNFFHFYFWTEWSEKKLHSSNA